jgi:hypothetical protein
MEKVMTLFEYEPLVMSLEPEISDEEEDTGDTNGVGPSSTKVIEQPRDFRGGEDSPKREVVEQTLEQVKFILTRGQISGVCIYSHRNRGVDMT